MSAYQYILNLYTCEVCKNISKNSKSYSIYSLIKRKFQSRHGVAVADLALGLKVSSSNPPIVYFFCFVSFEFKFSLILY